MMIQTGLIGRLVACAAMALMVGCATTGSRDVAMTILVQASTQRAIESSDNMPEKAQEIISAAEDLRVMLDFDGVTFEELAVKVRERIARSDAPLSEKTALNGIVTIFEAEFSGKVEAGVLDPEQKTTVNRWLGWVIQAAQAYAT